MLGGRRGVDGRTVVKTGHPCVMTTSKTKMSETQVYGTVRQPAEKMQD